MGNARHRHEIVDIASCKKRGLHAEILMASITNSHHNRGIKKMKR